MTKKAHLVGITYDGTPHALPECAHDARGWADVLGARKGWDVTASVSHAATWPDLRDSSIKTLRGADVAVLMHSMHGYWRQANGKRDSGIWPGQPVPHSQVLRELIEPLCAQCGTVIYILDACYSGGARHITAKSASDVITTEHEHDPRIKCVTISDDDINGDADPGDVDVLDVPAKRLPTYAVVAACGRRQTAFGAFGGRFGSRHGMSTHGYSLHTYNLVAALQATSWLSLKLAVQYMTWKNQGACDAFAPYAWWRGRGWKVPTCTARIGKNVPDNVLAM